MLFRGGGRGGGSDEKLFGEYWRDRCGWMSMSLSCRGLSDRLLPAPLSIVAAGLPRCALISRSRLGFLISLVPNGHTPADEKKKNKNKNLILESN